MRPLRTLPLLLLACLLLAGCPNRGAAPRGEGGASYDKARHVQAVIEVGVVSMNTGNYAKALSSLAEAEKLDPKNPVVRQMMGRTYFRMREFDKARSNYEEALALNPVFTDVHNDLGLLFLELKDYPAARAQFQFCVDDLTYASAPLARFNMGLLEEAEGNYGAASEIYQRLIASGEQSATPYFRLAYLAYRDGDYQRAADLLDAAVRRDPDYAEAHFLMGETYEKLNRGEDAAVAYGKAVTLDPQSLRGIEAQRRVREIMKDYRRNP